MLLNLIIHLIYYSTNCRIYRYIIEYSIEHNNGHILRCIEHINMHILGRIEHNNGHILGRIDRCIFLSHRQMKQLYQ